MFIDPSPIFCALWFLFLSLFTIWAVEDINKDNKEYGLCRKLENKRRKRMPAKLRFLSKEEIQKITPYLCMYFFIPKVGEIKFGPFVCDRWSTAGSYNPGRDGKGQMRLKGWRKFCVTTFLHEFAHHLEFMIEGGSNHDEVFVERLDKIFDAFEQLNGLRND